MSWREEPSPNWLLPKVDDISESLFEDSSRNLRLLAVGSGRLECGSDFLWERGDKKLWKDKLESGFLFLLNVTLN